MTYKVFLEGTDRLIDYANVDVQLTCGEVLGPMNVDGEDAMYRVRKIDMKAELVGDRIISGSVWVSKIQ